MVLWVKTSMVGGYLRLGLKPTGQSPAPPHSQLLLELTLYNWTIVTRFILSALEGMFTTSRYTNARLPLVMIIRTVLRIMIVVIRPTIIANNRAVTW